MTPKGWHPGPPRIQAALLLISSVLAEDTTLCGGDLRVGIVTCRGDKWQSRGEEILPLTHDLDRVREFLRSIRAARPGLANYLLPIEARAPRQSATDRGPALPVSTSPA